MKNKIYCILFLLIFLNISIYGNSLNIGNENYSICNLLIAYDSSMSYLSYDYISYNNILSIDFKRKLNSFNDFKFHYSLTGEPFSSSKKESFLRRSEILFFISIPFIYFYVSNLFKLNNALQYQNWNRDFDIYQKRTMYISFIFFGIEILYNDYIKSD